MEHDQRICPRCGKPAGEYRFCETCRAHIDSLTRVTPRAGSASDAAAQAREAVLRLEQALAAAAQWNSDRVVSGGSATAVQTEPDPAETDTGAVTLARSELTPRTEQRAGDRTQSAQAVARFEEVMTVAPKADRKPAAAEPAAPKVVAVETVAAETAPAETAPAETAAPEPAAAVPVAPPKPRTEVHSVAPPAKASVAPPAKREAFWYELAPSLKQTETVSVEVPVEAAPVVQPVVATTVEPELQAAADDDAGSEPGQSWMTAVCLLILIALVVALTGRTPRRSS